MENADLYGSVYQLGGYMRGTDNYVSAEQGKPTNIGGWLFCWNVPGFGLIVRIPMDCTRYALTIGSDPQVFYSGAWHSLSAATFENNNRGTFTDIVVVNSGVPSTFQGQALLISLGLTVVSR